MGSLVWRWCGVWCVYGCDEKMKSDFLVNIGDELYFENKLAFCNDILKLDITVPPRRKERQHFHKERYCIVLYLKKLVSAQLVSFPFGIKKNEFPDFVLFKPDNTSIGIEVSEIIIVRV